MSQSTHFHQLEHAQEVAERLKRQLEPYARRVVIGGSIRRQRPIVGDIDLVIEPLRGDSSAVAAIARGWGEVKRGGPKYVRVIHTGSDIGVCVNMVTPPAHWGVILVARTGPASLWLTVKDQLKKRGYDTTDGALHKLHSRTVIPCRDEETLFQYAGLPFLPPEKRDEPEATIPLSSSLGRRGNAESVSGPHGGEPAEDHARAL